MAKTEKAHDPLSLDAFKADIKLSSEAYGETVKLEIEDLKLRNGEHFTQAEWDWRKGQKKPLFTIDLLSGPCNQAANQPVPRIVVSPNGGGADPKSAGYWQGAARRVENLSGAEQVYKWGRKHAIDMGRGWWRIRADYFDEAPESFDSLTPEQASEVFAQDLRIEPILHQHSVYPDPQRRLLDGSDARFCGIAERMKWAALAKYPKATKTNWESFRNDGDVDPSWATDKDYVTVMEKYTIVTKDQPVCLLMNGTIVEKTKDTSYPPEQIKAERTIQRKAVKWQRATAAEIFETADVPGTYIPVVEVVGERATVEGKMLTRGLPRMARDPLRLVEFHESRLAEVVDLAAYDTWKAPFESTRGFEDLYVNAAKDRPGLLPYHHKDSDGTAIPEPEHVTVEAAVQGIAIAATRATMVLRNVLGMADVQPEEHRQEQSGKAILARAQDRAQTTSHFNDSTDAAVALTGKILISMGRVVYSAPRILRINGADEKEIGLVAYKGQDQKQAAEAMAQQQGQDEQSRHMLDVSLGSFDVTVSAGKGYETGRQETVDRISSLLQVLPPPLAVKATAILVKNLDGPGMIELAAAIDPDQEQPIPPQVQQRLQALDQFAQQATEKLKEQHQQLQDQSADRDSAERIAFDTNATKVKIEEVKFQHEVELKRMELDVQLAVAQFQHDADVSQYRHDAALAAADAGHEQTMAEMGHAQALEAGGIAHEQGLESADVGHQQALAQAQQQADLAPAPDATA